MGWVILLLTLNLLVGILTVAGVFYQKYHPNNVQKTAPSIGQIFGKRSKLKPKWVSDSEAYEIEQKESKTTRIL